MHGRIVSPAVAIALVRSRLTGDELEIFEQSDPECRGIARRPDRHRRVAAPTSAPAPLARPKAAGANTLRALRARAARLRRGSETARGLKDRARLLAPGPDVTVPSCASSAGVTLSAVGVRRAGHAIGVTHPLEVRWAAAPSLDRGFAVASHEWDGETHLVRLAANMDAGQVEDAVKHELQHAYQREQGAEPHEREAEDVARWFPDFGIAR